MNSVNCGKQSSQKAVVLFTRALVVVGILFCSGMSFAQSLQSQLIGTAQPASLDSIVSITAEAEGLTPVGLGDLPARNGNYNGTFWVVSPSGIIPPFPGLTSNYMNCPIWAIVDGIYLVDGTAGAVAMNPRLLSRGQSTAMTTSSMMAAAVNTEGNAIADLIEKIQDAQYTSDLAAAFGMNMSMSVNDATLAAVSYAVDYGTNLCSIQIGVSNGCLVGIASNTLADVEYELQSRTNLLQTDLRHLSERHQFHSPAGD